MADEFAALADSLGWALLHSIWQIALIAGVAAATLRFTSRDNPQLRFAVAYIGLIGTLIAFCVTFAVYALPGNAPVAMTGAIAAEAGSPSLVDTLGRATPLVSFAWLIGFALLCVRYFGALRETQRLRTEDVGPVPSLWDARFRLWVERLGADANTIILESARIATPLTIGALKPVVLVPAGFFLRLPPDQAEAILAHELAHICRQDYLLGLIQAMIRNIFFFHPAVYWLSRQIDAEREYACDARVVAETGDACALAKGLGQVALESGIARHGFAVAADGSGIKNRIRRLRERRAGTGTTSVPAAAIGSVFAAGMIVALGADAAIRPAIAEQEQWVVQPVSMSGLVPSGSGPVIQVSAHVDRSVEPGEPTADMRQKAEPEAPAAAAAPKRNARTAAIAPRSAVAPVAATPATAPRFVFAVATPNMFAERIAAFRNAVYQTDADNGFEADFDDESDCPDKAEERAARLEREAEARAERLERQADAREAQLERLAEQREAMLERQAEQRERQMEQRQAQLERIADQRQAMLERQAEQRERQLERAHELRERARERFELQIEGNDGEAAIQTLTISFVGPESSPATQLLRLAFGSGSSS